MQSLSKECWCPWRNNLLCEIYMASLLTNSYDCWARPTLKWSTFCQNYRACVDESFQMVLGDTRPHAATSSCLDTHKHRHNVDFLWCLCIGTPWQVFYRGRQNRYAHQQSALSENTRLSQSVVLELPAYRTLLQCPLLKHSSSCGAFDRS